MHLKGTWLFGLLLLFYSSTVEADELTSHQQCVLNNLIALKERPVETIDEQVDMVLFVKLAIGYPWREMDERWRAETVTDARTVISKNISTHESLALLDPAEVRFRDDVVKRRATEVSGTITVIDEEAEDEEEKKTVYTFAVKLHPETCMVFWMAIDEVSVAEYYLHRYYDPNQRRP